jgi:hypothetical protein
MKYLIITLLFTSCLTEKKVAKWNDEHKTQAAKYCADTFPPDTLTKTVFKNVDSSGYYDAYMDMAKLADSLFWQLDSLIHAATPDKPYKPNIDSLRKIVDKEIRKRLKPCVDSVMHITHTVVDKAREKYLQGTLDEKDGIISARDKRITELEGIVKAKRKWVWMFWILVVLACGYALLKLRFKLPI